MTNRPRQRRARTPRVEALEGKALLTIVTIYPFGHPDRARRVNIPDATDSGTNGSSSPANGTGASSGISGGTTSSEPAGNSNGSATGSGAASGSGAAAGSASGSGGTSSGTDGSASASVLKEKFHESGGHADYTLSERAGGETFTSSFTSNTRRVGPHAAAASVTPASAFSLFVNRLAAKAAPGSPAPATGPLPSAGDYTIQRESAQVRSNRSTYNLTIRSAGVQITESYTLTTTGSNPGAFSRASAFSDFVQRFSARSGGAAANSGTL